jgi:FlaG/FlaF family flagellin (archaellin)
MLPAFMLLASCMTNQDQTRYREQTAAGIIATNERVAAELTLTGVMMTFTPASGGQAQSTPQARRIVIKNATVTLVVENIREKLSDITALAEGMGGWIVSSEASQARMNNTDYTSAAITIRVPAENFEAALGQIKRGAVSVASENITGADVTDQYADLTSRVKNLQAAEVQLREILDSASNTEDVLRIFNELTRVRGEIETAQGRLNFLSQSAAFSSINVSLGLPPTFAAPATPEGWSLAPVAEQAAQTLVGALRGLVSLLTWLVIFVTPLLALAAIPIFIGWRVVQRFTPKNPNPERDANSEEMSNADGN